ncbi:MAG: hypothetical protein Q7T58_09090 [Methylotenera sp.]|nr:hypothetical protein [Methylotenera sp.]
MELLKKLFKRSSASTSPTSLAWINALKGMDDISAIEFSTQKLSEDFKKNIFQDKSNLTALFSVDENTHIIVERITTHFINIENINIELEERISNAVCLYHRQLFITYFALIEHFSQEHQTCLHVLLARAFRNATQMVKWRYYNYQSSPANVWLQLSELYKIAEQQSLLNAKIQSYADQEPISLSSAYIHACMLGTLESLSLKCQQIELVSQLLMAWTVKTNIDSVYDEKQHLFYVDTASNKPACRVRNFKPASTYRYWDFDSVNSKIELCMSLIEFNISPKQPLMKEFVNNKHAFSTFEILHAEWSRVDYKRQRRADDRSKTKVPVSVAYGYKEVCEQIQQYENIKSQRGEKAYQGDKSLDERLAMHSLVKGEPNVIYMDLSTDHATMVDECKKGLGLNVSKHAGEVSLGMMVGISNKEQRYSTKIGIIRNIRPVANNELHIGVELFSNIAYCAEAENTQLNSPKSAFKVGRVNSTDNYFAQTTFGDMSGFINSSFGHDSTDFTCLYLPKEQSLSQQETLIIPKLQYNKNDIFKVNILGEDILIRFTKSYEHHGNWVRVTFTSDISSKSAGGSQTRLPTTA